MKLCILAKEIRLKHKAPVLSIIVLDSLHKSVGQGSNIPSIESNSDARIRTTSNTETVSSHKVLICSEEQFKVKYKLSHVWLFPFQEIFTISRYLLYHI